MRFYDSRQSNTSPLKYVLEMSPSEAEFVKQDIIKIINKIDRLNDEKNTEEK